MDAKSIALLGFISKASQYLKDEFSANGQQDELAKLSNVNLDELKEMVVGKAEDAFSGAKETLDEIIQTGSQAFDDFIEKKKENSNIINEFGDLFDSIKETKAVSKVKTDLDELLSFYEPIPNEKFVEDDDEYLKMISEAAQNKAEEVKPVKAAKENGEEVHEENLDSIFSEIVENEPQASKKEVEVKEEKISANDAYLKNLIAELRSQLEEEKQKEAKADRISVFEKISNLYPYLSGGFIRAVYNLKESISKDNPIGKRIVILHRVYFKDVESLRQFVEIVSNHDYTVNVDETKFVVDVFKEHVNTDGKILTNIFEIANQAKVLDGDYEGYRIVKRED